MKIKNVVKVMNFHALIRVDAAKRKAKRYQMMEREVMSMLDQIMNNRNLTLDKNILKPGEGKPTLTVYLGSDYGFCSNYNSLVNGEIDRNPDGDKILIGKKLRRNADHVLLRMDQDELESREREVEELLKTSILRRQHSAIDVVFVRYINAAECRKDVHRIFPIEIPKDASPEDYKDDFMIDGEIESLIMELTATWLLYEIQIIRTSGYASENILRQNTTSESLKKIDEIEEEQRMEERREKRAEEFSKVIENYQKKAY
ncbi:MAG: F0F1 ATP synthase subunit gamma [Lachnospiraceae bacterium]|nr:F0F1 ATP synthase subunit gamma [Lachnospiraceae bacterium]